MKIKMVLLIISYVFLLPHLSFAKNRVIIIVHNSNTQELSIDDVKNIYTDNIINWKNGNRIKLYNTPVKSPIRELFSQKILNMSAREAATDWANRKITNTAKNPPKTKKIKFIGALVARDQNAIGYVSADNVPKNVRVVLTIE